VTGTVLIKSLRKRISNRNLYKLNKAG
ncbi:uncharacterized protein METZ01_LOCUS179895, partial [marine metagenome]